jgi:hypothetical protein
MRLRLSVCLAAVLAVGVACGGATPASLQFVDIAPAQPRLGDITTVRFKAIDERGNPAAGVGVNFALQQANQAGVALNPTTATTTKTDGIAETTLTVTGGVTSVVVVATAGDKTALSPPISFAGSAPNAAQFTFQCGPLDGAASGGIHAIRAYDASRNMIAGVKLRCSAHVADRNGEGIPNAQVSFLPEAGAIGPSETTATDVIGNAEVLYKTSLPLPEDVAPGTFTWTPQNDANHTGDYLVPIWMEPVTWTANPVIDKVNGVQPVVGCNPGCPEPQRVDPMRRALDGGDIVMNPRDNLVAMIAVTSGEEAFTDTNNNGKFDPGEPFIDTTEPFVDSNDNGTWDPGERYIDTNGNGKWDGKNGTHEDNTLIWASEKILWTGIPSEFDSSNPSPTTYSAVFNTLGNPVTPPVTIPSGGSIFLTTFFSDPWFNGLTRDGNGDGCKGVVNGPVTASGDTGNQGIRTTYPPVEVDQLLISDARSPDAGSQAYAAQIVCNFTDSPEQGAVTTVPGAASFGSVGP